MRATYEMNKNISKRIGDKITKFCKPLVDHLKINHFYHIVFTHSGHFAAAGLHMEWHECLFSNPEGTLCLPYIYHNREKLEGFFFSQTLQNNGWEKMSCMASQDFNVNLGLNIIQKIPGGIEGFGFGLKTNDPIQHMALLNELPLLHAFLNEYKKQIKTNILFENLVDVASLIGPSFFEVPKKPAPNLRQLILGKMKIKVENPFTRRESEVIEYLLEGYSASQTGDKLFLSKRTIEHHIERIKDKLDCTSKLELIQKLRKMKFFLSQ